VRGEGSVELEDLEPVATARADTRRHAITADEVVSLVNAFLRARFFDAAASHDGVEFVGRREYVLLLRGSGGIDGGWIDLTMRLGRLKKTVRLSENIPTEFHRLVDLVLRIGGRPPLPQAWPAK
jgi:hypothetical protein